MQTQDIINRNYKQKAEDKELKRKQGPLIYFRSFNNLIKSVLITLKCEDLKAVLRRELDLRSADGMLHVLDVGCGKGGEIKKWAASRVALVVGVDVEEQSLLEYKSRLGRMRGPFQSCLVLMDCGARPTDFFRGFRGVKFDLVSAQFCMHYMFNTKERARNFIQNMTTNLLSGGFVIATIPDAYSICKKVFRPQNRREDGSYLYDNDNVAIRFVSSAQTDASYGLQYGFYLNGSLGERRGKDEIEFIPEWLIDLDNLQQLFRDCGCEIIQSVNFIEYYKRNKRSCEQNFRVFGLQFDEGEGISEQQWEDIHLYRVLVAEKKTGPATYYFQKRERAAMCKGLPQFLNMK